MVRQVTKLEEQAYRLRHHDFEGLTMKETAERMDVSERTISRLLKNLKQKAPQLFPILTSQQFFIYNCYVGQGMTQQEIAKMLGKTRENITLMLQQMQDNGMPGIELKGMGDVKRFIPKMENHIKTKF